MVSISLWGMPMISMVLLLNRYRTPRADLQGNHGIPADIRAVLAQQWIFRQPLKTGFDALQG